MSTISVLVKGTARENSDAIDEARAESSCSMGVGCGTSGVCWAKAHNAPEMCARTTGAADFNAMAAKCRKADVNTSEHGAYAGVIDVARNGVDEVIRLTRQSHDLALLVRRLLRRLIAARNGSGTRAGDDQLSREAMDYLRRKGLAGQIIREDDDK